MVHGASTIRRIKDTTIEDLNTSIFFVHVNTDLFVFFPDANISARSIGEKKKEKKNPDVQSAVDEERRWLGTMFDLKAAAAERVEKSGSKTPKISNDHRESNMRTIEKNNRWNLGIKHQRSNVDVERRRKTVQVSSTT